LRSGEIDSFGGAQMCIHGMGRPVVVETERPTDFGRIICIAGNGFALIASLEAGRIQFLVHFSLSENGD
jgi:hypothetical protein